RPPCLVSTIPSRWSRTTGRAWVRIFFFQAEDGIRDRNVTGVQTCALPIFVLGTDFTAARRREIAGLIDAALPFPVVVADSFVCRSEERRVGKEWRARSGGWAGRKSGGRARGGSEGGRWRSRRSAAARASGA